MRNESCITALSWIPSEAIQGATRVPFDAGITHYDEPPPVNIGWGEDLSIRELATLIARVVGFRGRFEFDAARPDGTPRKVLDVSRLTGLGFRPRIDLESGIARTYAWYREHAARDLSNTSAAWPARR